MNKAKGFIIALVILFILGTATLFESYKKVDAGEEAIIYTSKGVLDKTLPTGRHFINPRYNIIKYPIKTRTKEYKEMSVATRDGKNLKMSINVNYHVRPDKVVSVYNKFGKKDINQLEEGYIRTRVLDGLRLTLSRYTVIESFGVKTPEIKTNTLKTISKDLAQIGVEVEDISLSSPEADGATQDAINSRVKAEQELQRAETDKKIAEKNAERKKIEAKGEAEANNIKARSLNREILEDKKIEKWSGSQPIEIGGTPAVFYPNGEGK